MGDFSYLKDCIKELKDEIYKRIGENDREQFRTTFTMIDSQIFNLERFIENESRKKVEAVERIHVLESELIVEKTKREKLEKQGAVLSEEDIRQEQERNFRIGLAEEAKDVAREALRVCLDLRRINKIVHAENTKNQLQNVESLWETIKIKQIVPNRLIISLETSSTINDALELRSVVMPVYGQHDEVEGIITLFDIIGYIEDTVGVENLEETLLLIADPDTRKESSIGNTSIIHIVESLGQEYFPIFHQSPISSLINVLNKGFVQIPVCDDDHMIINIVSQGFLVNIIASNINTVQPAVVHNIKTIKQLNLIEKNKDRVFTVSKNSKVIEALHIMHMVKSNIIAVLDDDGSLYGNISLNDFKGLSYKDLGKLLLTVEEFSVEQHIMIPITCTKHHTLKNVVQNFIQHKPEHIWIVNKKKQPKSLVLISDVLNLLEINWESVGWN